MIHLIVLANRTLFFPYLLHANVMKFTTALRENLLSYTSRYAI